MSTTEKRKATQIRFEGPDADVDRISGDEIPQWYVYAADPDNEMAHFSHGRALNEAGRYQEAACWRACCSLVSNSCGSSLPIT